jgi:hypothetical protein
VSATVAVFYDFGGTDGSPGTQQDITGLGPPNIRFKRADNATIDNQNPIPVPPSGTNYSRWKQLYLKVTGGTFTQIDNIRFYSDGTNYGTGITLKVGLQFPTNNSGAPGSGYEVADTDEQDMVTYHGGITSDGDAFSYTSGSPLSGPSISESGSVIDAVNEMSNYIVFQLEVVNGASAGDLNDETLTLKYDEI